MSEKKEPVSLACAICKTTYLNKQYYNDHLKRNQHKRKFLTLHHFYSDIKPDLEMIRVLTNSNKLKE